MRNFNVEIQELDLTNLEEKGRIQYFYHYPYSGLPIRDIGDVQNEGHKTEPHIEIGAENYLNCCRQTNIKAHLNNNEKYLFLVTRCANIQLIEYNKIYIVGYIIKEKKLIINDDDKIRVALKGKTYLFPFNTAMLYYDLFDRFSPVRLVDKNNTRKIINHFNKNKSDNLLIECVNEIKTIEDNLKTHTCLTLDGKNCRFINECLRWNN